MNEHLPPTADAASVRPKDGVDRPTDEAIYQNLLTAIIEHHLEPGAKLPEDTLAQAFGVSRTRIRKSLQRLAHENLITLQKNRSAAVAHPSVKEARDVFQARRILETGIASAVAERRPMSDLAALRRCVDEELRAAAVNDMRTAIKLSGEFHLRLAELLGNATLTGFLYELISRTSLIVSVYQVQGRSGCRCDEHAELIELFATGDAAGAAHRMAQHLEAIEQGLVFHGSSRRSTDLKDILAGIRGRQPRAG